MTKHNKMYMAGETKFIKRCCECDYSTIGSKKDVDLRFKLHIKKKHGVDKYEEIVQVVDNYEEKVQVVETINSKDYHIMDEPTCMAEFLKLLKK